MSVMIIVAYHLVGGHWRVDHALQSRPTQAMLCRDNLGQARERADIHKTSRIKFDVFCSPRPHDV